MSFTGTSFRFCWWAVRSVGNCGVVTGILGLSLFLHALDTVHADTSGSVTGQVLDQVDHSPLPGIKIDLYSEKRDQYLAGTTTGMDGRFTFPVGSSGRTGNCYVLTYVAPANAVFSATSREYFNQEFCLDENRSVSLAAVEIVSAQAKSVVDLSVGSENEFIGLELKIDLFTANSIRKRETFLGTDMMRIGEKKRLELAEGCYVIVFIAPQQASARGRVFSNGTRFDEQPFCTQTGEVQQLSAALNVAAAQVEPMQAQTPVVAVQSQSRGRSAIRDVSVIDIEGDPMDLYTGSYALVVGLSDYTNGWDDLSQIPRELGRVKQALELHGFEVVLKLDLPTKKDLETAFLDFRDAYGFDPGNRLVVYFAGHGFSSENSTVGHLVASNAPLPASIDGYPGEEFLRNSIQISQMMEWAGQMTVKHALFLFDSCFSGIIFKSRGDVANTARKINFKQVAQPVRQFITSGSANELVPAKSVFVQVLVEALTSDIADFSKDGYLTGQELGFYLKNEVPRYSQQSPQVGTHSSWDYSRGDFVFSLSGVEDSKHASAD